MCKEGGQVNPLGKSICCGDCAPKRYNIVRLYRNRTRNRRTMRKGLTLADAQAHCKRDDTHGPRWFDSYEEAN